MALAILMIFVSKSNFEHDLCVKIKFSDSNYLEEKIEFLNSDYLVGGAKP